MNNVIIYDSEGNVTKELSLLEIQGNDITDKIVSEENVDELDKLTQLFSLNQKKKQIVRKNKLSILLDKVDNEVINRLSEAPDTIDDRDLIKYWSVASDVVNGTEDNSLPKIQINNQTNINVNNSGLNRESRAKVLDVVNKILNGVSLNENTDVIDVDVNNSEEDR